MSASTALDLVNQSLLLVGEPPIDALPGTTHAGTVANTLYNDVRDTVLSMHPWNEAIKRVSLSSTRAHTITAVSTGSKTFTFAGNYVDRMVADRTATVSASTGNDGAYTIASAALSGTSTVVTVDEAIPSATADGTITAPDTTKPAFGFNHGYELPGDFMRLYRLRYKTDRFRIEGDKILSDAQTLEFMYVSQLTDVDKFSRYLFDAIKFKLAAQMARRLRGDDRMSTDLEMKFQNSLDEARYQDSQQAPTDTMQGGLWADARFDGVGSYPEQAYRPFSSSIVEDR